jgi:hypothetical protein
MTKITIKSVETKARRILQDTVEEYRWSSEEMREALQEGVYALNAIRPETRYVNGILIDFLELPLSDDEDLLIKSKYEEALVHYVVYKCYLTDSTDTANAQLAEMHLSKFNMKAQM